MKIKLSFKSLIFLFGLLSGSLISSSQQVKYNKSQVRDLEKSFQQLSQNSYSSKWQLDYFNKFPKTFHELNYVFGYYEYPNGKTFFRGELYSNSDKYIDAFFDMTTVNRTIFFNRCIEIVKEAKWQADGVNFFLIHTRKLVQKEQVLILPLILDLSKEEQFNFWYALFDGPIPPDDTFPEYEVLKEVNENSYQIMKDALVLAKKNNPQD